MLVEWLANYGKLKWRGDTAGAIVLRQTNSDLDTILSAIETGSKWNLLASVCNFDALETKQEIARLSTAAGIGSPEDSRDISELTEAPLPPTT
jgi:hypothetical protein